MQITGSNAADEGDCRLMMELPQNTADLQAYIVADYSWVSAPKKCGQMAKHFKCKTCSIVHFSGLFVGFVLGHSFGVAGYQFLCPNHRLAVEGTTSGETEKLYCGYLINPKFLSLQSRRTMGSC